MNRRRKRRSAQGTITRHHGFWCLRFRERIRVGDTIKTIQRSKRLAPIDAEHKTRKSVEGLVATVMEPVNKVPATYVAVRLGDFVENTYLPFVESKRKPSTFRGYTQMWNRYLKPRTGCTSLLLHNTETRTIQSLLDEVEQQDKLAPQTMAHIKHLLSGIFRYAIRQGHAPTGTMNPVTSVETASVPDFDGRAYTLEEIALMFTVLPEPSRTVMMTAAFSGLRVGELRGLTWDSYTPGDENSLGVLRVLRSIWRGRVGAPKTKRSKAVVPLIPQVCTLLELHRATSGNPATGPIFANGAKNALDLDSLYQRQMKEPLRKAGIEWEGWHGFRRGLATNLERIGVRESIAAMILRHTNDRVTRKHYIKPAPVEAIVAMRQLSETFSRVEPPKPLPANAPQIAPQTPESDQHQQEPQWLQ
jgi:integrase